MKKTLLIRLVVMSKTLCKIIAIVCVFSATVVANPTFAQKIDEVVLELMIKEQTVVDIFKLIESRSNFKFLYSHEVRLLTARITYSRKDGTVKDALDFITEMTNLEFKQNGRNIAVNSKNLKLSVKSARPDIEVTGVVVDANTEEPLPGANVVIKGTVIGTSADANGKFSLLVPEGNKLVVSYIGYATQEVEIGAISFLKIALKNDAKALQEIVVVGYGTQTRSDQSGSVVKANAETISQFPSSSFEQSLNGKLPGVQFLQSSGQPGSGISVRVRGVTSIAGGNEPLYVIDGIPFFNSDVRGLNGLAAINPNDIQSIEVLKDAAATAIYGSRGGNGVILITTKAGLAEQSKIQYSNWFSLKQARKTLDVMDGEQFLNYQREFYENSNLPLPEALQSINNANTNWQDEVLHNAFAQNHDLSFSGGSQKSQYYTSFGYLNEEGIIRNSNFERFSIRTNLKNQLNEILSLETSLYGSHAEQNGLTPAENSNTLSITKTGIGSTLLALPTEPVYNPTGQYSMIFPYSFAAQLENPVAYVNEATDRNTYNRFLGNVVLKANFLKHFTNNLRVGLDFQERRRDAYYPKVFEVVLGGNGTAILQTSNRLSYLVEDFLNYKASFKDIDLDAVAGVSIQKESTKTQRIEGSGFISDDLTNNAIQAAQTISTPVTRNFQQAIASAFARASFKYRDRYLLEASIRSDGASVFSEENKVATFPSLAVGWRINEESFLVNSNWISNLKLRASWGKSGNQAINPYQSLPLGVIVIASQGAGTGLARGLAPNLPNRNLTWESTEQSNVGLDFDVLHSRYRASLEYYQKKTVGALSTVQLPPNAGFSNIIDNVGQVENQGFELSLEGDLIKKDKWSLTIGGQVSRNINQVSRTKNNQEIRETLSDSQLAGAIGGAYSVIRVGEPLGAFVAYKFTGLDESGVPQYNDLNQDGQITPADLQVIGSPFPKFLYGLNTTLTYNKFSLLTTWQGVQGASLMNVGLLNLTQPINYFNRAANIYDFYPNPAQGLVHRVSDRFVEDASFLRLRNVTLKYVLPLQQKMLQNVSVFMSVQNALTFTNYSGYDPEVNSFNGNDLKQGVDLAAYPNSRTYTVGLNLNF